jgi:hypothetical protein
MPKGIYTSARGEVVNMDELQQKAKLPINPKPQAKSTIKKRDHNERKPLNVRGFRPAAGAAKLQSMPEDVTNAVENKRIDPIDVPQVSSYSPTGEVKSMEDITGMKVQASPESIQRAKDRINNDIDTDSAVEETLGSILSDLEQSNPNAASVATEEEKKTPRPRTRKTATKTAE